MRLSMWILYDWLKKYRPEPRILQGEQVLRSARILSNEADIERQNVYLARASEFISGEEDKVICVQGKDMILLNTKDMDEVLNAIFDAFDFYNSWADGLAEETAAGCSVQDIVDRSDPVFRQPLLVYNSGNEVVGISSGYPKGSLDEEWDVLLQTRTNSMDFLMKLRKELKLQRNRREPCGILWKDPGTAPFIKAFFQEESGSGGSFFWKQTMSCPGGKCSCSTPLLPWWNTGR